ncbi:MAG: hypothetical protein R3C53_15610 [Pirellulaceae bacterium]
MCKNYFLVVLLLGCIATQTNAQSAAEPDRIDWLALTHDSKATKFDFRVVDEEFLLKEGIDVKLLRQVLRMNKGQGMGGPSTPFTLDVRFTAKWNLPKEATKTTKP